MNGHDCAFHKIQKNAQSCSSKIKAAANYTDWIIMQCGLKFRRHLSQILIIVL